MRYIVAIRKRNQPTCYYLAKSGFRCYTPANVWVMHSLEMAKQERDYFASLMPDFELTVEVLPANVRWLPAALLSASPVEGGAA